MASPGRSFATPGTRHNQQGADMVIDRPALGIVKTGQKAHVARIPRAASESRTPVGLRAGDDGNGISNRKHVPSNYTEKDNSNR